MGSQRRQSGARHPRSPLPRTQAIREKLKNVQRKPHVPAIPASRPPGAGGGGADGGAVNGNAGDGNTSIGNSGDGNTGIGNSGDVIAGNSNAGNANAGNGDAAQGVGNAAPAARTRRMYPFTRGAWNVQ